MAWTVGLLLVLPLRLWLARCYWRRSPSDSLSRWIFLFSIGAGLTSFSYGVASAAAVLHSDQLLQMIVITGQGAYATVAAVRNNAVPRVATFQGVVPLACLAAACLATRNPYYMVYSVLVLLHLVSVIQIARFLGQKTRDLLVAERRATEANARLEDLATTDPLTSAVNRRGFDAAMSKALAHAARHPEGLSLLLLDIDHFKALNDAYGHQVGDECLCAVARCLRDTMRPSDVVSRHGGEEFAILLPATRYAAAACIAERVRIAIRALNVAHPTSATGFMTVSVGYATIGQGKVEDAGALIKRADGALYRAKAAGRNRTAGGAEVDDSCESAACAYDLVTI